MSDEDNSEHSTQTEKPRSITVHHTSTTRHINSYRNSKVRKWPRKADPILITRDASAKPNTHTKIMLSGILNTFKIFCLYLCVKCM